MSSGGGRTGARVAVKMEVAPFYAEEGLELLPDFVQLPGFGGGPGAGGATGLAAAEDSGADPHKLLLAGKKPPRDLVGAASPSAVLPPAGPFASLRPRVSAVHRLIPETPVSGGPEVGPSALQPLLKLPAAADLEQLLIQAGSPGLAGPASPTGGGPSGAGAAGGPFLYRPPALEEPQTVPEAPGVVVPPPAPALSSGESPPPPSSLSPLDAESQERLKAERKRLRNRIAASKCRRRKLERIARLEEKVKALKGQNAELAATASLLRAQVNQLQGRVRSHLSSGCHINAAAPGQTSAASGQPPGREGPTEPETSAC
ncbi:PREDICTED: transcription factor jun-D-like [Gekko japonicus]|uniref:Transcription factor JunB n=1 Tax=Gekko japonicus TaxID=146911 RepID=A0ABM1KZS2_GEKJA|nr:PREDICTED: transcription factor jun-D-like [Gekko japonicus]